MNRVIQPALLNCLNVSQVRIDMKHSNDITVNKPGFHLTPDKNESKLQVFDSLELFGKNNEIQIMHEGEVYRIRITRNGKLIMNK